MKRKALSKILAVAAFGLVTANASIDAKAAEGDNIIETSDKVAEENDVGEEKHEKPEAADVTNTNAAETSISAPTPSTDNAIESTDATDDTGDSESDSSDDAGSEAADGIENPEPDSSDDAGSDVADDTENSEPDSSNDVESDVDGTENSKADITESDNSASAGNTTNPEDTDNSSATKEPSDFEEAKENLEKAEQEEAAAKDKVNNAQSEVDQAKADLDDAKQEAETADSELKKAEEEKDKAETDKTNADQAVADSSAALEKAESDFNNKLTESGVDQEKFTEIQTELDHKKAEIDKAQQKVDKAQEECDAQEQEVSDDQAKADAAQKAVEEAQEEKNKADEQVSDAAANVENAQKALEDAKKQTSESTTDAVKADMDAAQQVLNQINEQINKGSLGFFEEMAAAETDVADSTAGQAVEVLTSTEDMRDYKGEGLPSWDEFRSYTQIGSTEDATSLDNMKKAFDFIRECNQLRTGDDLRPCGNDLLVTDYLMAIAQMNANWAQESNGEVNSHSSIFNVGENLAWYPSGRDPYDGWYTKEKENYKKTPEWAVDTGHYMNITDNSYTVTGLGVRLPDSTSKNGWLSYAQEFDKPNYTGNIGKTYTIDEYEKRFDSYYNKVKEQLAAAQKAYDEAKAAYDKAVSDSSFIDQQIQNNITAKQKELDDANEALNNAKKQADEKNTVLKNTIAAKAEADKQLTSAQTVLSECYEKLTEVKAELEQAQKAYDEACDNSETMFGSDMIDAYKQMTAAGDTYKAAVAAQEEADIQLEKAQTALMDATSKKETADKKVADKEAVLTSKNAALSTAKKEYSLAVANLAIAQDDYNRLKPAEPSYAYGSVSENSTANTSVNDAVTVSASANGAGQTVTFSKDCSFKFFIDKLGSVLKENASSAITIDCSGTRWYSINTKLLNTIKEKADKEFVVVFSYKGQKYTFTIPANYDFNQLQDSNGWYGFMYLNMIFGGHAID